MRKSTIYLFVLGLAVVVVAAIASAAAPFTVGSLAESRGFTAAFAVTGAAFLFAAFAWIWIPETRGSDLR